MSPWFQFFGVYPEIELLNHVVTLYLMFWVTIFHSDWKNYFIFPSAVPKGSNIFTSWPTLVILFVCFNNGHPSECDREGNGTPLQMKELGRLQSMGSQRVKQDWVTSLSLFTFMHWRRKWQSTPVFSPGESQGWGSLVGCCLCRVRHNWSDSSSSECEVISLCGFDLHFPND